MHYETQCEINTIGLFVKVMLNRIDNSFYRKLPIFKA